MADDEFPLSKDHFRDSIARLCEHFNETTSLIVRQRADIVDEVYSSAMNSLKFHGLPYSKVNHCKTVAHLGFWIHRLQPIRLASPASLRRVVSMTLEIAGNYWWGADVREEQESESRRQFEESMTAYEARNNRNGLIPINQYIAWAFVYDGVSVAWNEFLEKKCNASARARLTPEIQSCMERYQSQAHDLIWSLRYHSYTSRSFATLVEVVFRIKGL